MVFERIQKLICEQFLVEPETVTPGCQRHRTEAQWWDVARVPCKTGREFPSTLAHLQDAANWLQERKILFGHSVVTVMNPEELKKYLAR